MSLHQAPGVTQSDDDEADSKDADSGTEGWRSRALLWAGTGHSLAFYEKRTPIAMQLAFSTGWWMRCEGERRGVGDTVFRVDKHVELGPPAEAVDAQVAELLDRVGGPAGAALGLNVR